MSCSVAGTAGKLRLRADVAVLRFVPYYCMRPRHIFFSERTEFQFSRGFLAQEFKMSKNCKFEDRL